MRLRDLFRLSCRRQSRKALPRPKRRAASVRLWLQDLEERAVPSTITWTNRGQTADNFQTVFGASANLARSVVDTAISEWTGVISNFNQTGGGNNINVTLTMNTAAGSSGGSTNITFGSDNKPRSAAISLGRTGDGTNAWYLNPTLFASDFLGTPSNAFAGYAQAGSAAVGKGDFLEVVTHELGHAMGFESNTRVNALAHDTGVPDNSSGGGIGHYYAFVGTGGFRCLLTSFNSGMPGTDAHGGEHFASGSSLTYGGNSYSGADDLMTPSYGFSQRKIVSRNDAFVLRDAMGYTVNDPAALGTFYAVLNPANGNLLVRGRQDAASADTITLSTMNIGRFQYITTSVAIGTPVPGTFYTGAYTFSFFRNQDVSNIHSISVATGAGGSDVAVNTAYTPPISITGHGRDRVIVGSGASVQAIQAAITITNPVTLTNLYVFDNGDPGNRTVTIGNNPADPTYGQIIGLAPGNIYFHYGDVTAVDVYTGTGAVTTNVLATGGLGLNLHGNSPNTAVNVGNAGSLAGILGAEMTISNINGTTAVTIDDRNRGGTRTVTLDTVTTDTQYVSLRGLSPLGTIYAQCTVSRNVDVYTGTGAVTTNVLATCGRGLNLHGNSPNTTVNVGNAGSLAGIQGVQMTISNTNGDTAVTIDDRNRGGTRTVTVSTVTTDTQYLSLSGSLIPGTIYAQCTASQDVNLYTGTGAVTINVLATCGRGLNLHGNSPNTTLVGPDGTTNLWQLVDGVNDELFINGSVGVVFGGISNLVGGSGDNTFQFSDGYQLPGSIDGGVGGSNTLDYSAYSTGVDVNFQTGTATGVAGTIADIQNVLGGQGANILVGDGNENLTGGPGQNLLISGGGSGQLTGGGAGDLLIGGTTAYDTDDASLQAILSYWTTSGDDYPTRVANLRAGNGVPQLEGGITVFDNGAANTITGNGSEDQGLFNLFYVTEAGTVTDQQPDEVVVDIDNPAGAPRTPSHDTPGSLSRDSQALATAADGYFLQHRNELTGMNVFTESAHRVQTSTDARLERIASVRDVFAP